MAASSGSAAQSQGESCEVEDCGSTNPPIWYCVDCCSLICDACWPKQLPHKPKKVARDRAPHEKVESHIVAYLRDVLEPSNDPQELQDLHFQDQKALWFGVMPMGAVAGRQTFSFINNGRYEILMRDYEPSPGQRGFPRLVSFVGETNAGKSSLVKMLIQRVPRMLGEEFTTFPAPVPGSTNHVHEATTGDVHLYADPSSWKSQRPMLFADCEGLGASESKPFAIAVRERTGNAAAKFRSPKSQKHKNLSWMNDDQRATRSFAVSELFPRLLYTFSDVVVFVADDSKQIENACLTRLISWADSALEKTLNQPQLPHAVIVLNKSDITLPQQEWDVDTATAILFEKAKNAILNTPYFKKKADWWRARNGTINTTLDLVLCYYQSISVLRIPGQGRFKPIDQQIGAFQQLLNARCDSSLVIKQQKRQDHDASTFGVYLNAGFEHFSEDIDIPFNFQDIAERVNPLPKSFKDHVVTLASSVTAMLPDKDGGSIFKHIGPVVASSIYLDLVNREIPGDVYDVFERWYSNICIATLDEFCDSSWPCGYNKGTQQCKEYRRSHLRGHRNEKAKIISTKAYEPKFGFSAKKFKDEWVSIIKTKLGEIHQAISKIQGDGSVNDANSWLKAAALRIHKQTLATLGKTINVKHPEILSRVTTCFSCLMRIPEHTLCCGHILCSSCVKDMGTPRSRYTVVVNSCPLHEDSGSLPTIVRFKPAFASLRILCLDGGGMRGIVALHVLKACQDFLGKLPLQSLLDLIIGTSTGGIISLGFGVKQWSIDECIKRFTRVCSEAFSPREFRGWPALQHAATLNHGSLYRNRPFRNALEREFGKELLFGGPRERTFSYQPRVAVTSTTGLGSRSAVLGNYSRPQGPNEPWDYEFSEGQKSGPSVWQAACATSAAPPYFKPLIYGGKVYHDGALFHNNPIKVGEYESRLLWPDMDIKLPDVLISIGTGQNAREVQNQLNNDPAKSRRMSRIIQQEKLKFTDVLGVIRYRFEHLLDSEAKWIAFLAEKPSEHQQRYLRINPDLGENVPELDNIKKFDDVVRKTESFLQLDVNVRLVEEIVSRLVASSFYFEHRPGGASESRIKWNWGNSYTCKGWLRCRLEDGTDELRDLGRHIRSRQTNLTQLRFTVQEREGGEEAEIPFTNTVIDEMINYASFRMPEIDIRVSSMHIPVTIKLYLKLKKPQGNELAKGYPISGFPRSLSADYF